MCRPAPTRRSCTPEPRRSSGMSPSREARRASISCRKALHVNGKTYYFCAAVCKRKFDANPKEYVP
ncbi:MAG: YHS domain-containing protein [Luteitalea sp.]|nr:YHS domain-containing protein [Luteitalea sp.]